MAPLRIIYLMEDTDLSGGVRVQLAQADAMIERGHSVTIATRGLPLTWRSSNANWIHLEDFSEIDPDTADVLIGTFWKTVRPAFELAPDKTVHLCQGYEALFTFYQDVRDEIEEIYRLPVPVMTVSPHLTEILAPVTTDVTCVGQIVDEGFFRPHEEVTPPRVLLAGAWEIDIKGIDVGYGAVAHARTLGAELDLIRVSPWRPSPAEAADIHASEFHVSIPDVEMQRVTRSCQIVLGTSRPEEGFGLPVAEGMAGGLAPVLTKIPSYLAFSSDSSFALFVPVDDPVAMGEALTELVLDPSVRRAVGSRARNVAGQFRSDLVAERIESFITERFLS